MKANKIVWIYSAAAVAMILGVIFMVASLVQGNNELILVSVLFYTLGSALSLIGYPLLKK